MTQARAHTRIDELTAARGVAALLVVVYHAANSWHPVFASGQGYSAFIVNGWMWVSFFFVLSGFVMMHAYGQRLAGWNAGAFGRFVFARFGRIYPLYLATTAAFVACVALGWLDRGDAWWTLLPTGLLLQGFVLGKLVWNVPSWSISTEWYVYLAFPLFVPLLVRCGPRIAWACTFAFAAAAIDLYVADVNATVYPVERLVGCGIEFALGCCVHRLVATHAWPRLSSGHLVGLVCLLPLALMALPVGFDTPALGGAVVVSFAAAIAVMASQPTLLDRPLRHPAMQFLGRISYSIYLDHAILYALAVALGDRLLGRPHALRTLPAWIALGLFPVYLLVLIALSDLTFRWIEEPARLWFKRRADASDAQPAAVDESRSAASRRDDVLGFGRRFHDSP